MVGTGGSRKDESVVINSTNAYAALGSLRKKKKNKEVGTHKPSSGDNKTREEEKEVFWAPAPLTAKSWADVDDEDDDDYYATTAPPASVWGSAHSDPKVGKDAAVEESESEEEGHDEEDDIEDEHEPERSVQFEPIKKPAEASLVQKDTERQLSKKELKKKGLEELDAVLAELGYAKKETSGDDFHGTAQDKKEDNEELGKKESAAGESKNAKKKKKKEKSLKGLQDQPVGAISRDGADETAETVKTEDAVDVKERLKKVVSSKKKKSSKEMDAAARAAATEAAARKAKLAAAKKKEKSHYNQQPMR